MPEQVIHGVSKRSADYQLEDLDVLTTVGTGGWMVVGWEGGMVGAEWRDILPILLGTLQSRPSLFCLSIHLYVCLQQIC